MAEAEQANAEGVALAGLGRHRDEPAMCPHDALNQRQAQPTAGELGEGKRFEDLRNEPSETPAYSISTSRARSATLPASGKVFN